MSRRPITVCASRASIVASSQSLIQGPNISETSPEIVPHCQSLAWLEFKEKRPRHKPRAFADISPCCLSCAVRTFCVGRLGRDGPAHLFDHADRELREPLAVLQGQIHVVTDEQALSG